MQDNLDDLIADYLSDTLEPEMRQAFEERIAAEPELAARVALEREVAAALNASSPENKLRANLQQLSEKYNAPENLDRSLGNKTRGKSWQWWVLITGMVFGGLAYWNFRQQGAPRMVQPPKPNLESPATPQTEDFQQTNETEKNAPIQPRKPIAAAFKPIPKLESYIGSHTRNDGFRFHVDEPQSGSTLSSRVGQTTFRLAGNVEGKVPATATFRAMIFSTNLQNFEATRPVESHVLEFSPLGAFVFQKKIALGPGLYYLLIEEEQSGEWVFVDKFLVK